SGRHRSGAAMGWARRHDASRRPSAAAVRVLCGRLDQPGFRRCKVLDGTMGKRIWFRYARGTAPMIRCRLLGAKNSVGERVWANSPRKRLVSARLEARAAKSWIISGGGGANGASWHAKL